MSEDDDYGQIIAGTFGGRRSAVANIGGDPDKAARSLALSQAFGVPAAAIMGDLDTFEANRKAQVAGDIVGNNKYIGQYVQEFPLADIVSNDDYHNLDKSSESISKLNGNAPFDIGAPGRKIADAILHGISSGFVEGVGEEPLNAWMTKKPEDAEVAKFTQQTPLGPILSLGEIVLRGLSGGIKAAIVGTAEGVEEAGVQIGMNPSNARRLGRELGAMVEQKTTEPPHIAVPGKGAVERAKSAMDQAKVLEAQEGIRAAKPWLDQGVEPPLGVHPFIDKVKIEQSKIDLKDLQEAEKDAQASVTRERSPEAYAHFVATHGERTIGISPDTVRKLYGDKVPEAEDGKLGFIPRLMDQLQLAELSGDDIRVPLSEWLAKVEPEVAKELRDDIRVRKGGVTKNEVELAKAQEYPEQGAEAPLGVPQNEPLRQARASAGLLSIEEELAKLAGGKIVGEHIEDLGAGVTATLKPAETYTAHEKLIVEQVQKVLSRIVPELTDTRVVPKIEMGGKEVGGVYVAPKDAMPLVAVSLNVRDAGKTARHEAIHFLRDYGFFEKGEWAALEKAAREDGWLGKHNIRERYKKHVKDEASLLEEAIAEEFGEWGSATEAPRAHLNVAVQKAFEKLAAFFKEILDAMKETFGHSPTIDELFEKIESGEVGRRAQEGQRQQGGVKTAEPELPGMTRMEDRKPFEKGLAAGMPELQYQRYLKLMQKQKAEDQAKALEKIVVAERRKQSAEWKAHEVEERKLAIEDVNARRDIQADKYLRDGELFGDQVDKVRLNGEYLTKEQREALPKSFVNDKSGMHPDDLAALFGYHSGAEMIEELGKLQAERTASGMRPMDYNRRLIAAQTERRMEAKYGDLSQNILESAKDQMLSDTQLDLLHEETIAAAELAGAELPIKREQVVEGVREQFENLPQKDISSDAYLAAAGRAAREMEAALLKGDFTEAFRQKQRQYMAIIASKEAMVLKKEQAQFEAKAKRYMGRDIPKGVEQEYGNYIQQLLADAGRIGRLSPEEIAKSVAFQGYDSLDAFVNEKSSYGHELEVPLGYKPRALEDMTVAEFRDFKAAIDTLDKAGRDEKKINVAGEKQDYAEWRARAIESLKQRPVRSAEAIEKGGNWLYAIDASLTKTEELMKSLDFREEMGPFFSAIMVPYELSKAKKFTMITELSAKLKKLSGGDKEWQRSLEETIPQDFVHDLHTGAGMELTRWNMIKMMLNFGTEQNLNKLAQGIASAAKDGKVADKASTAVMRGQIEDWVHQNASAKDWKFVQEIFDLFEDWKGEADTVYRNLAGRPPKWIPEREIETPHGTFRGGYFPLIPDKLRSNLMETGGIREGTAPGGKGPLGSDYYKATTSTPFYKERTGAAYFVDITNGIENLAGRMQQVIHDIAYRDFVVNASKIIYDPKIMNEIKRHYGPEYAAQLEPWLKRVANENTGFEAELQGWNSVLRQVKGNLMLHALPLNYAVMLSPSTGVLNLKQMIAFNASRTANKALVTEHSKELPHILYSLDRDITDVLTTAAGQRGWSSFQKHAAEVMMRPLVWMEQQTRMVTFYSEFMNQKEKGLSDAQAAVLADSRIRTEHGAAGYGDLPALMASKNQFVQVATTFMGWFTTQRNWLRQVPDQARQGDVSGMAKTLWGTIGISALFNAALFQPRKESDTLWSFLGKAVLSTPMTMVPYVREGWNYATQGFQPTSPMFGLMKATGDLLKDGMTAAKGKPVKNPIRHSANVIGQGLGVPGTLQIGRTGEFLADVAKNEQRPRNMIEWMRGLATGEAKLRK